MSTPDELAAMAERVKKSVFAERYERARLRVLLVAVTLHHQTPEVMSHRLPQEVLGTVEELHAAVREYFRVAGIE